MPWRVTKKDGEWVVVKADSGEVVGRHGKDETKAKRQLVALNINVHK